MLIISITYIPQFLSKAYSIFMIVSFVILSDTGARHLTM